MILQAPDALATRDALSYDDLQGLTYLEVKGSGLANRCPIIPAPPTGKHDGDFATHTALQPLTWIQSLLTNVLHTICLSATPGLAPQNSCGCSVYGSHANSLHNQL
jgi:hypothetical protein